MATAFGVAETVYHDRGGDGTERRRLRPIPNESLYLYVKSIDNSRVVRQADPQARRSAVKFIGGSFGVAVLLVGLMLPHAYGVIANYQLEALKQEQRVLTEQRDILEVEEASLTSTERLIRQAQKYDFAVPPPSDEIYVDTKSVLNADAR